MNKFPEAIYLWQQESEISKNHFKTKGKAMDSMFRKHPEAQNMRVQKYTRSVDAELLKKTINDLIKKIDILQNRIKKTSTDIE